MDAIALHLELRNALSLADELGRHEHALGNEDLAGHLSAMRTSLGELEREVGRSHHEQLTPEPAHVERLEKAARVLRERLEEIPVNLRPRVGQLMASLERIVFAERKPASPVPAKPVLGGLPLRRVLPQEAHSVIDYLAAAALFLSARFARTRRARAVGLVLGAKIGGAALVTDCRFSAAKWLPIEVHELVDHGAGVGAVLAPFVLRYRKTDRVASTLQIAAGLGAIVAALFTDYRAEQGVGRAIRSRGGPAAPGRRRRHVPEIQRPLEGLSHAGPLPRINL
jgi:hypothetical protein